MSTQLGPVHTRMYDKIKKQDEITAYLLNDQPEVLHRLDDALPPVSRKNIEEVIDNPNIHGWLQSQIDIVEARLSYALHNAQNTMDKMYEFGKRLQSKQEYESIDQLFQDIYDITLDGMPCDHALSPKQNDEGHLYLMTNVDTHETFAKHPLHTDPSLSLSKTCEGDHDHDHHDTMDVQKITEKIKPEANPNASLYYQGRFQLLRGFLEDTKYRVDMISPTDFKIY